MRGGTCLTVTKKIQEYVANLVDINFSSGFSK